MTKQTTEDVLYDFYRKEDATVSRDYFGEQEIIIPHGTTGDGYAWRHSEFALDGTTSVYIANIPNLNGTYFTQDGYYDNFYHTTSLADGVIDAEKSSLLACDANMCWAATDSNLMFQTGWFTSVIENEDDIFNLYRQSFLLGDTHCGHPYHGADWYLTGNYNPWPEQRELASHGIYIDIDDCLVGTGGYFANVISPGTNYLYRKGLASVTGAEIVPVSINYSRYWSAKSWDGFQIPKPFSKVTLMIGSPIAVPPHLDHDGIEKYRQLVEDELMKITVDQPEVNPDMA